MANLGLAVLFAYVIFFTVPIFFVSLILTYCAYFLIKKKARKKISFKKLMLIPISLSIISVIFFFPILSYYNDIEGKIGRKKVIIGVMQVRTETIKKGQITQSNGRYAYTCKTCGYTLNVPQGWGLIESSYDNPEMIDVILATSQPKNQSNNFDTYTGQPLSIRWSSQPNYRIPQNKNQEQKTANGTTYNIYYSESDNKHAPSYAVAFPTNNPNIEISAMYYGSTKTFSDYLNTLLSSLTFIK